MSKKKSNGAENKKEGTIGKYVRDARKHRKMSQEELASAAGVVTQTISNIETDNSAPRRETVRKLAAVLHVSMEELTGGKTDEELWKECLGADFKAKMDMLSEEDQQEIKSIAMFLANYKLQNHKK